MSIDIFQSFLLGIVQGLSEFLPVSSSGHLVLLPWVFGFPDPGLAFDVALHAGTLISVLAYFYRDWFNIFGICRDMPEYEGRRDMLLLLVVATIPGAIAGFFLESLVETVFRHPILTAAMLAIFGGLLLVADRRGPKARTLREISFRDAVEIGAAQALSIIPGVSRSGITMTVALARGFDRVSAARFSFLLSTPIIFGAMLPHIPDFVRVGGSPVFLVGVIVSAVSGYVAIRYLLRFVEPASYQVFFWYRLLLASCIVTIFLFRM